MNVPKVAIAHFSGVVRQKSIHIQRGLKSLGAEILPWKDLPKADGAVVFNIHGSSIGHIQRAFSMGKPIVSLQEGMYAIGWTGTLQGMRDECSRANNMNIMQFVWSRLEVENYIKTGKHKELLKSFGNPEYDILKDDPKLTRCDFDIPEDAFVITHIDQYAHPRGGPNPKKVEQMVRDVQRLTILDDRILTIQCLHPQRSANKLLKRMARNIVRPFRYPIFDILKLSDLVITISSTEGITAAVLGKDMIEYDVSDSSERWPFVAHGVAKRAISYRELSRLTKDALNNKLNLKSDMDYQKVYQVDGQAAERTAGAIIQHFTAK